jgi:hypothetical protein
MGSYVYQQAGAAPRARKAETGLQSQVWSTPKSYSRGFPLIATSFGKAHWTSV